MFGFEPLGLQGLGPEGINHLPQVAGESAQVGRIVTGREPDHQLLGTVTVGGSQAAGNVLQSCKNSAGLLCRHQPFLGRVHQSGQPIEFQRLGDQLPGLLAGVAMRLGEVGGGRAEVLLLGGLPALDRGDDPSAKDVGQRDQGIAVIQQSRGFLRIEQVEASSAGQ